jgi:DNA-binding transcriptional ArsR family regulator
MSAKIKKQHAQLFSALGDETRLALVNKLCENSPQSVSQLCADATISRQGVSKHLKILQSAGLIGHIRDGRLSLYEFRPALVIEAQEYLDLISQQWDDALVNLQILVED